MALPSQRRAVVAHRKRQAEQGIGRFEVQGLQSDRAMIRDLAKRLAAGDDAAFLLRAQVAQQMISEGKQPGTPGRILAALRRSPLVGANLDISRDNSPGRDPAL